MNIPDAEKDNRELGVECVYLECSSHHTTLEVMVNNGLSYLVSKTDHLPARHPGGTQFFIDKYVRLDLAQHLPLLREIFGQTRHYFRDILRKIDQYFGTIKQLP